MGKHPAAKHGDVSVAESDGALGEPAPVDRDVRVNGRAILLFGDKGLYPTCAAGSNVPWWASEGYALVRVNGQEASGAALATGSINGLGEIRASGNDVFIGGPTMSKQERARAAALARMAAAEESVYRWNAADRALFKKWFGDDTDAARFAMLMNLQRMHQKLSGAEVKIGNDESYAHVYPYWNGNTVMVDQEFWQTPQDNGGTWERDTESGVLIHESSHFVDTAWTGDHAYGHDACEALAREHPSKAQDNADSIEYFCEETPM